MSERPTDDEPTSQTPQDTAHSVNSPDTLPNQHNDLSQGLGNHTDPIGHMRNPVHGLGIPGMADTSHQMPTTPVNMIPPVPNLTQLQHKFLPLQQVPEVGHQPHMSPFGFQSPQYPHQNGLTPITSSTVGSDMSLLTPGAASQGNPMMMLDQMAMPGSGPVFGVESGLQKSPAVGMPEDFMAYLFNSLPENSQSGHILSPSTMK